MAKAVKRLFDYLCDCDNLPVMTRTKTPERVAKALEMRATGLTRQAIADELGISEATCRQWTDPARYETRKRQAIAWTKANACKVNQRMAERRKLFTQEQRDTQAARQRARYASDPRVRARLRKLAAKYRQTAQGRLGSKARLMVLAFADRMSAMFTPLMQAITGLTREQFTERFSEQGHFDHITPVCAFDLTNPEHLVRCNFVTNLRIVSPRTNGLKGSKGRDIDVMTLPWSQNPDALIQAQAFISRQLAYLDKQERQGQFAGDASR